MRKTLDFAKDNAKKIKQDKIGPYKHDSPQILGYNLFGGKVGPKSSQVLFCKEEYIKLARNHNKYSFTNKCNIINANIMFETSIA